METLVNNKTAIKTEALFRLLEEQQWGHDYSLMLGKGGYLLLLYECSLQEFPAGDLPERMSALCETIFEDVQLAEASVSYCSGLAGLYHLLHIVGLDDAVDDEIADRIAHYAMETAQSGLFDFLHGSAGMVYALSCCNYNNPAFFENWINELTRQCGVREHGLSLPMYAKGHPYSQNDFQYNYSISHGIASVLIVVIGLLEKKQVPEKYAAFLHDFMSSITQLYDEQAASRNESLYPSIIKMDGTRYHFGRIGWCYGDFGIALLFNRYMKFTGDRSWHNRLTVILDNLLRVKEPEDVGMKDADLCHGAAGIAVMFRFFGKELGEQRYHEAAEKWYAIMLRMDTFSDGLAGYKHFNPDGFSKSYSLLEGISGLFLTMLTFGQDTESKWQECFLIR